MKSSELCLKLKKSMEKYKKKVKNHNNSFNGNDMSIQRAMSKYNLENFNEIINSSCEESDIEINQEELKDLEDGIYNYFSLHAPDDEEFREFIKIISIYLTFIAKKPLHPPGIKFSNETTVYKKGNIYYCTGKSSFIKQKQSLCKYCIAK
jgi:uncharacterized protein (UPF0305 family)